MKKKVQIVKYLIEVIGIDEGILIAFSTAKEVKTSGGFSADGEIEL